jgi:hypothetical protein
VSLRDFARKFGLNYLVMGGTGLPNLAINAGAQAVLDVWFHWSGFMALAAYFVGLALSMTYTNAWSMWTESEFTFMGRNYHFSHRKEKAKD